MSETMSGQLELMTADGVRVMFIRPANIAVAVTANNVVWVPCSGLDQWAAGWTFESSTGARMGNVMLRTDIVVPDEVKAVREYLTPIETVRKLKAVRNYAELIGGGELS